MSDINIVSSVAWMEELYINIVALHRTGRERDRDAGA